LNSAAILFPSSESVLSASASSMRFPPVAARPRACARGLLAAAVLLAAGCTTTLNRAIQRDQGKAIDGYLAGGSNVNEADKDGATPLINAAQFGDLALMKRLVEGGANVNASDKLGNTALIYLASGDTYKDDAVSFLISHGADTNRVNYRGQTALLLASVRACDAADADRQAELLSLLLAGGAHANDQGPTGELPLHLASFAGQPEKALACLVQATKDPHALSFSGYNAFTEASRGDRRATGLYLAGLGFAPQMLVPEAPRSADWPPFVDTHFPINARTQDFYGDFLSARHQRPEALVSYRGSAASYDEAIAQYKQVIDGYALALKKEKSARANKIMGTIAMNVLGAGLGAATGVGFFVVPKRSVNDIDEFEEEINTDQSALNALTKERSDLNAKIQALQTEAEGQPAAAP
jgi:ankyrin repeat protein